MKKLTVEQHQNLGEWLKRLRLELKHVEGHIAIHYGASRKPVKLATKAYRLLDDMRWEMERFLNRDCPALDHDMFLNIYSGELGLGQIAK